MNWNFLAAMVRAPYSPEIFGQARRSEKNSHPGTRLGAVPVRCFARAQSADVTPANPLLAELNYFAGNS
jgi:hypothetical protein